MTLRTREQPGASVMPYNQLVNAGRSTTRKNRSEKILNSKSHYTDRIWMTSVVIEVSTGSGESDS